MTQDPQHEHHHEQFEVAVPQQCKDCGRMLTPVIVYLHPAEKEELDWLIQDRKQNRHAILSRLITLEGSKRRANAARRIRKKN